MNALFCSLTSLPPTTDKERLEQAITQQRYPTIYAILRQRNEPFPLEDAVNLCLSAIDNKLTLNAFLALLDHCPPVSEMIRFRTNEWLFFGLYSLVEKAAAMDRPDILKVLLERGGNLNRMKKMEISPLEAALEHRALNSLEFLVQQPGLHTTLTPRILTAWSFLHTGDDMLDFCLQTLAPTLLGRDLDGFEVPIPDALTLLHAAKAGNWRLFLRIYQERGAPDWNQTKLLLPQFAIHEIGQWDAEDECIWENPDGTFGTLPKCQEPVVRAQALNLLLSSRPSLLKGQRACIILVTLFLNGPDDARTILRPWIDRIQKRQLSLHVLRLNECTSLRGIARVLELWKTILPNGPFPALDCRMDIPYPSQNCEKDCGFRPADALRQMFQSCPLTRSRPKTGQLSPLARTLLEYGSPTLIEEQLQPNGLLAREDPELLLSCCGTQNTEYPYENRAALSVCLKREVSYEL